VLSTVPVRSTVLALLLLLAIFANPALCSTVPLTAREVGLMLRSGYTSEAILRELSARHFAEVLTTETENQLQKAGASAALLAGLRDVGYHASSSEVAALAQKRNSPLPSVPAANNRQLVDTTTIGASSPSPEGSPALDQIYRVLKGDLVCRHDGVFAPFDDEKLLTKKFFLFFFSSNGSPAGRKFTPRLMEHYQLVTSQHPEFEVIFFSGDRSQFGMETYMNQNNMPWPAVAFSRIDEQASRLPRDLVKGIPYLILLDSSGKLLSRSGDGDDLEKVLTDLDKILQQGGHNGGP
jgi:hypothetical protein